MLDTGKCAPESLMTLLLQQADLITGGRDVQMFPTGTKELFLPDGLGRFENERGVFHFRPDRVSAETIAELSNKGRENEFLKLGPYSKVEIDQRFKNGERLVFITEYTPAGTEVRCAGGTDKTLAEQLVYFESTKEQGNTIKVGAPPRRVSHLLKG